MIGYDLPSAIAPLSSKHVSHHNTLNNSQGPEKGCRYVHPELRLTDEEAVEASPKYVQVNINCLCRIQQLKHAFWW